MTKRKAPVEPPKPLPQRGSEESESSQETTLCKGTAEDQGLAKKEPYEPILGWCINGCKRAAYSWVDKLCYGCHNHEQGLYLDSDSKRYVPILGKGKKEKKRNGRSSYR